ncbi:undecaprenyl-phosphate glucose phosphotransferase [Methylobacter marinus]|jgi:Undecaprenyl-phosphate glucose phosphotransferase|uniref:undecaprenyl-phosphate glucose phosphotransferase n=1 Tax=Methylobacter marinus TaxID=34058 RepID=UPI000379E57F|nr:undecaprenyl-phosphate glucose phosphotransferase [Methylobacter marinus]
MRTFVANPANIYVPRSSFSIVTGVVAGLIALGDCLILFGTGTTIYLLYPGWTPDHNLMYFPAMGINALFTLALFYFSDLYKIDSIFETRKQFPKIIMLCTISFLVLVAAAFALKISTEFSRTWAFYWLIAAVCGIYTGRLLARQFLLKWTQTGTLTRNVAVVGAGEQGNMLVRLLKEQQYPWIKVIGVFDDRTDRLSESMDGQLMSGNIDNLVAMARVKRIDDIIVALPWGAEARILAILHKLQVLPANIRLSPDILGFKFPYHDYSYYNGIPTLNVFDKPLSGWDYILKSIEDKVLTIFILVLIAPILIIVSVLIKLDSPGPVLFRQKRYGFNNQLIEVLKFRTMYIDKQDNNASQLTTRDDPRVTRIGRFLRRTSLDELPQFFNVLTGEMSIVGPRPHATEAKAAGMLYENVVYQYASRHRVKPGITGWAQVNGWRGDTDTEEKILKRVEHDIAYINNWSITRDLKIILKTVLVVLIGQNAY